MGAASRTAPGRDARSASRLHLRRPKAQRHIVRGRPARGQIRPCRSQMLPKDPLPMRRPSRYLLGYVEDDEAATGGARRKTIGLGSATPGDGDRDERPSARTPPQSARRALRARLAPPRACSPILSGVPHLACGVSARVPGVEPLTWQSFLRVGRFGKSDSAIGPWSDALQPQTHGAPRHWKAGQSSQRAP